MTGRKAAEIVATFKRMKAVGSIADERRVVVRPSLRPVATKDISEADTELIRHDQAGACDQQHFLPPAQWSQCPSHCEHRQNQRRPSLDFRRRVGEPAKSCYFVKVITMNKEGYGSINPKIAD